MWVEKRIPLKILNNDNVSIESDAIKSGTSVYFDRYKSLSLLNIKLEEYFDYYKHKYIISLVFQLFTKGFTIIKKINYPSHIKLLCALQGMP